MNQTQKNYAMDRIRGIERDKIQALRNKFTHPGKILTGEEKIELLLEGSVSLKGSDELKTIARRYNNPNINDVFDFTEFECPEKFEGKSFDKEKAKIIKQSTKIKDQLMLGNAEKALKMITDFETKK